MGLAGVSVTEPSVIRSPPSALRTHIRSVTYRWDRDTFWHSSRSRFEHADAYGAVVPQPSNSHGSMSLPRPSS
jgi:hypothetical protein